MQELMTQHGAGNQQNPEQQNAQEDAKREADERRQMMLSQILSSQARERHFDKVEKPEVFVDDLIDLDLCPPSMVHDDKGDVQENIGDVVGNDAPTIDDVEPEEQVEHALPVARIALVKPEKARGVEDVVLRAAQMGQIVEKVSEERLISLLEQINNQTTKQTKVTIQRRRSVLDDDD
ncbi:hypothetical protein HHK36_032192 [Tetracentron sinense]|uniref:Uncharacterized protein n=1 Tax=Tetracentron sinense TaxID=13715 RepID=A0A834YAQ0_TETSI|nr:hypothetical protein HHK36_032192 [Tetracentron sinense]